MVFDFGGGTLDISVLIVSKGLIDVAAHIGDMKLGGLDLDHVLLNLCE